MMVSIKRGSATLGMLALAAWALAGCVTGGGGGSSSPNLGTLLETATYSVSGDTLRIHRSYAGYLCSSDSPSVAIPDSDDYDDETVFEVNGNEWVDWYSGVEAVYDPEDTSEDPAPVATVQVGTSYVREGKGTGRDGTWRLASTRHYRVISGTLPEAYGYEREENGWTKVYSYRGEYRQVSGDTLRYWRNNRTADAFIAGWKGDIAAAFNPDYDRDFADSANYDITVSKVDQYTVKLKGRVTGEVVLRHLDDAGVYTFSSDEAGHSTYVYDPHAEPDCNNPVFGPEPEWYGEFLADNMYPVPEEETTAKRAAKAAKVRETLRENARFEKLFSDRPRH